MASLSPPPLLVRETKKYSLREKADAPPAGPWGWEMGCDMWSALVLSGAPLPAG